MKRRVTVYLWLLVFSQIAVYLCGIVLGYSLGEAHAGCTGWDGRWFQSTQCTDDGYYSGGQNCTSISFGPFFSTQCTPIGPPLP